MPEKLCEMLQQLSDMLRWFGKNKLSNIIIRFMVLCKKYDIDEEADIRRLHEAMDKVSDSKQDSLG